MLTGFDDASAIVDYGMKVKPDSLPTVHIILWYNVIYRSIYITIHRVTICNIVTNNDA